MTTDNQPKGLGDIIENITKATGIKKLVEWAFGGVDCGCDARKEKLNKLFPRKRKPECLLEDEYNYLKYIKLENFSAHHNLNSEMQRRILKISNRIFSKRQEFSTCSTCVKTLVNQMQTVLKAYEKEL
tara:strand:- start:557 stop:940 length:384 start_codon:yes stop_codon:yes gene_type:complete